MVGYYDRYLFNSHFIKMGICFEEQIVDALPYEKTDIPMDLIITNKEIYR